jgi:NAD/NADP transhydrogenase beta subunit
MQQTALQISGAVPVLVAGLHSLCGAAVASAGVSARVETDGRPKEDRFKTPEKGQ